MVASMKNGIVIGSVFICLLGVVHYYKLMIRAEPLFPNYLKEKEAPMFIHLLKAL